DGRLPIQAAISTLTLAELTTGPQAAPDLQEMARRLELLQRVEANVEALPFDAECARTTGRIVAAVTAVRRKAAHRKLDLMIAAPALSIRLPLYTLNAADFRGLDDLVEVIDPSQPD